MIKDEKHRIKFRLHLMAQLMDVMPQPVMLSDLSQDLRVIAGHRDTDEQDVLREATALSQQQPEAFVTLSRVPTNRSLMQAALTEAGRVHLTDNGY